MRTADFFAGLGGFSEGARQAGARPVFAANHWAEAVHWHERNHPNVDHVCQELGELDKRRIPDVDLFVASPACQGFSPNGQPGRVVAGAALRHQADRNTAWAVISAADTKRPDRILVENVPQMADWELFPAWLGCLQAMGYQTRVHVFDAADFGAPQRRRRLVVTACQGRAVDLVRPTNVRRLSIGDVLEAGEPRPWQPIDSRTPSMQARMRAAQNKAGGACYWSNVDRSRGRALDEVFPAVTTKIIGQAYLLDGDRCRMFSARELARVQGFPDSYQIPENRALAGKLIGNAIPVPMASSIVAQMMAA